MNEAKLVNMANQIATFFRSQPGTDQAERVAAHLKDYWEPRMRQQLTVIAADAYMEDGQMEKATAAERPLREGVQTRGSAPPSPASDGSA